MIIDIRGLAKRIN